MYYELIILGIVALGVPLLVKSMGLEVLLKPFDYVGLGGVFFLLAAAFHLGAGLIEGLSVLFGYLLIAVFLLGILFLVIGALIGVLHVIRDPDHGRLEHHKA